MGSRNDYEAIYKSFIPLIIAAFVAWIGYETGKYMQKDTYNPRDAINNVDTFFYNDTAYKVRIYIDSVYEINEYNEPVKK